METSFVVPKDLGEEIIGTGVSKLLQGSTAEENSALTKTQLLLQGPVGTPTVGTGKVETEGPAAQAPASGPKVAHTLSPPGPYLHVVCINEGIFSTDEQLTRAFMVTNIPRDWPTSQIADAFNVCIYFSPFPELTNITACKLSFIESNQRFQYPHRRNSHHLVQ